MIVYEAVVEDFIITVYDDGRWKTESASILVSYGVADSVWRGKQQAVEDVLQRLGAAKAAQMLNDLIWVEYEREDNS